MADLWTIPVYRNAQTTGNSDDLIGVVLLRGDDIVGFISPFDFRDTNMDGRVSFGESVFASVGFNRAIFVSTAIKQLEQMIADPNSPTFDYNQIPQLRFANMMHGLGDVALEVLRDAAVDLLVSRFASPLLDGLIERMVDDSVPQFLLTAVGEVWLTDLLGEAIDSNPAEVDYEGYDVRFVGQDEFDDLISRGDGSGSQIIYSTNPDRPITAGASDDTIILGLGQAVDIEGGGGVDTLVSDMTLEPGPIIFSEFATETPDGLLLFDGTLASGIENFSLTLTDLGDDIDLTTLPSNRAFFSNGFAYYDREFRFDLGAGDDTAQISETGFFSLDGGAGEDTLIADFSSSDRAFRMGFSAWFGFGSEPPSGQVSILGFEEVVNDRITSIGNASAFENVEIHGSAFGDNIYTAQNGVSWQSDGGNSTFVLEPVISEDKVLRTETNDRIWAGGGDDAIQSGGGVDYIDGGEGVDVLMMHRLSSGASFTIDGSFSTDAGLTLTDGTIIRNIERLEMYFGDGDHTITNRIEGGEPDENVSIFALLGAGDDHVDAVGANIRALGGAGFDTAVVDLTNSRYTFEIDYRHGPEGVPHFDLSARIDGDVVQSGFFSGFEEVEILFGATDYVIYLADTSDYYVAGAGNDTIIGHEGDDTLIGGGGNDVLIGGAGADRLDGGNGDDAFGGRRYRWQGNFVDGTTLEDSIDGGAGDDYVIFDFRNTESPVTIDFRSGVHLGVDWESIESANGFLGGGDDTVVFESFSDFRQFDLSLNRRGNLHGGAGSDLGVFDLENSRVEYEFEIYDYGDPDNVYDTTVTTEIRTGDINFVRLREKTSSGELAHDIALHHDDGVERLELISFERLEFIGTAGDDNVSVFDSILSFDGLEGNDVIQGGRMPDFMTGGLGDDILNGGSNVDTAGFRGNRSDYTITQTSIGVFEVVGPDGVDTLSGVEFLRFDDQEMRLRPGDGVSVNFETADPAVYQSAMNAIRDFDGNDLGGDGAWLRIGSADVNGDGDIDQILVNDAIGRFATVGTAPDGLVYFEDYSWAGETRVAGIYIDPLVEAGVVERFSDEDSQRRFQNDLQIENINRVLGADDYDGDGIQEVYFALTDGTAYLRALMHEDGNIRYANYQSEQEVIDYLTENGFGEETFGDWFEDASSQAAQKADTGKAAIAPPEPLYERGDIFAEGITMGAPMALRGLADPLEQLQAHEVFG